MGLPRSDESILTVQQNVWIQKNVPLQSVALVGKIGVHHQPRRELNYAVWYSCNQVKQIKINFVANWEYLATTNEQRLILFFWHLLVWLGFLLAHSSLAVKQSNATTNQWFLLLLIPCYKWLGKLSQIFHSGQELIGLCHHWILFALLKGTTFICSQFKEEEEGG